jgi:hypothetical protein
MVTLEKIDSSLFPNLYDSFLIDDDPLSDEQDWRNVFDYPWDNGEGHCGYALLDDGKVVGMLGMVFSERLINGSINRFCNLHTWWVHEDYRGQSLRLLNPLLKLDGYTITHFTPCDTIRAITKKLGFQQLCSQLKILLPNSRIHRKRACELPELIYDADEIAENISGHNKRIMLDHRPYGCGNLMVREEGECCYLLYTHVVRHRLPYCHIHYVSNRDLFLKHERAVRASLLKQHPARFVAMDTRLVSDMALPLSFNFWAPAHAVYKSADLRPEQVDNLYSDVVFLKLTSLPDMSHELGQMAKRMWPFSKHRSAD